MDLSFLRPKPSNDLSEHVENFWFMRGAGPLAMPDGHRILPDGSMEFVFQFAENKENRMIATFALALLAATGPADVAFMKGAWEGGPPGMKFEERWTEEAGGLMLGVARTIKGDRAVAFEFLRIEFRKDGIFYIAQPGGKPKTEFKLTASDGKSATFENPAHDHPKMIRYSLNPDGSLKADLDGAEGKQSFSFKPVQR